MFYIFTVLGIISVIVTLTYFRNNPKHRKGYAIGAAIASTIIGAMLVIIPLGASYFMYLNIKADYYGVIAQYGSTIDIYADKAIINVDKISFTDLKYQGYQKEIADLIKDLRYKVANYNSIYIKKKTLHENLMFSWIIIPPDSGMKLLQMTQKNLITKEE